MQSDKKNIIVDLTFQFSLDVIKYVEGLESQKRFVIANQLLRSGISIGANVREAQNAESKADFIHKIKIAAKEADETHYFLLLCNKSASYPACDSLIEQIEVIIKVLSKIIGSSKRSLQLTEQ